MGIVAKCYLGVNNVARLIYSNSSPTPPASTSWADASDADILSMVTAAYAGQLDLTQYWNVGDVRNVSFSALPATYVNETHAAQTVPIVLTNVGGRKLADGTTDCKFQWAMQSPLAEMGYMNATAYNTGGWDSCGRRLWCNGVFKDSCTSNDMNSVLFKEALYKAGKGNGVKELQTSTDYCSLLAVAEMIGEVPSTSVITQGEGTQLTYYQNSANLSNVWTRSPAQGNGIVGFAKVYSSGSSVFDNANTNYPILVCGVI